MPKAVTFADPLCPVCKKPVPLEGAKTDSHGRAVHEECYLLIVRTEAT